MKSSTPCTVVEAPEHIVLSRTDSIGDVVLTLPLAGLLKQRFPGVRITFIGRGYTRPVLERCSHVDRVITFEELTTGDAVGMLRSLRADAIVHVFPQRDVAHWAKSAGIPRRIGTSHRWWHWLTCNERVSFSRRKSELHEAQLNVKLLGPLGMNDVPDTTALAARTGFVVPQADATVRALLRPHRVHVVLHPGSKGSAAEWGLARFAELIRALDPERYQVFITGTKDEADRYRATLPVDLSHVIDTGGTLTLDQLIQLIGACDALVAASTGPLHIAAASGIRAIGLFVPRRPVHPGRWVPIGRDAHALVFDPDCADCAAGKKCDCIRRITPQRVLALLEPLRAH